MALIKAGLLLRADKPLVGRVRAGKALVASGTCHPACRPWLPSCKEGEGIKQLLENIAGKAALGVSRLASFFTIIAAGWGSGGAQAESALFLFYFFLEITPGSTDGAACVGIENLVTLKWFSDFFLKTLPSVNFFCGHPGALRCTWR